MRALAIWGCVLAAGPAGWALPRSPIEIVSQARAVTGTQAAGTQAAGTQAAGTQAAQWTSEILPSGTQAAQWTSEILPSGVDSLVGIACPTPSICFAVGSTTTSADTSAPVLVKTIDGGGTWITQSLPASMGQVTAITCPAANTCFAVGASTSNGPAIATTDDGSTWSSQGPPNVGPILSGIACPTTSQCFATGGQNLGRSEDSIAATSDGGGTWTSEKAPAASGYYLSGIACPSASTCDAAGSSLFLSTGCGAGSGIDGTTDGGGTWAADALPSAGCGYLLKGIACPSASACTAVGQDDADPPSANVATTTDGGGAWTDKSVAASSLLGIACPTATICDAVGTTSTSTATTGTILATTDGGGTWAGQSLPTGVGQLAGVACPSVGECFAVGTASRSGAGVVLRSPRLPLPTVTGVSPDTGLPSGGTQVTITGTNFASGATVAFGTVQATAVTVESSTQIAATSPAGSGIVDVTVTAGGGTSAVSAADRFGYVTPSVYNPLTPARICDTRQSQPANQCTGKTLGRGGTDVVAVAGKGGVPSGGATAVVVNVTATDTTSASYFTVWPDGGARPTASSLNFPAGHNVPNLVTVALPADGKIDVYNAFATADLVVDVEGYFAPGVTAGAGLYNALTPARICDTRTSQPTNQCTSKAPPADGSLDVQVTGKGRVPTSGVAAVVLNVTAIQSGHPGFLTVYPAGGSAPTASNVNYRAVEIVANRVIVPVSASGRISIYSGNGAPQVAADVTGYFTDSSNASATGGSFTPAPSPVRICDTRASQPKNPCTGKTLTAGATLTVTAAGANGVPTGATAVVLNVTAADATSGGYFTVFPAGTSMPTTSDLNFGPREAVADMGVATLGTSRTFDVYNARGSTDVIVDLVGWFS